jgi:hypothetical protein
MIFAETGAVKAVLYIGHEDFYQYFRRLLYVFVKFSIMYLHMMLLSICEFRENRLGSAVRYCGRKRNCIYASHAII